MDEQDQRVSELASIGGKARAESLTAEQRSEIARRAVEARWEKTGRLILRATHGSIDRPLRIGDIEIPCYVLENGTRVITNRGLQRSLQIAESGGAQRMANFVRALESKGLNCNDLAARILQPVEFKPLHGGRSAFGYEATILADICDMILDARKSGLLQNKYSSMAQQCEILVRGFARVGIIALIDEATGYQEVRDRLALQAILDKFLRKEFAAWAKRFPDEFYQEIFRLRSWKWQGMQVNRPQCVAAYTKDLVYARLAPGILKELEVRNPLENGRRKSAMHQWLTEDVGHPALAQHLYGTIGLMRINKDGDWASFMKMINKAYPRRDDLAKYPLFKDLSDE